MSTFGGTGNGVQASGNSVNNNGANNSGAGSGSQNYGQGSGSNHVSGEMWNNQGNNNIQGNNNKNNQLGQGNQKGKGNNIQKGTGNKNLKIAGSVRGGSTNSSGVMLGYSTQKGGDVNL